MRNSYNSLATPNSAEALANTVSKYNTVSDRDQSKKFDGDKIRMELIPTSAYVGVGKVLTHGAEKYGANTWQDVEYERYIGALIRHLIAFIENPLGVDNDSGLLHSEHLLTNAVFLNDAVVAGRIPPK